MKTWTYLIIFVPFLTACSIDASIGDTFGEAGALTGIAAAVKDNHASLVGSGADMKKQQVLSSKFNKYIVMTTAGESTDNNFQQKNGWTVRMSLVGAAGSLIGTSD